MNVKSKDHTIYRYICKEGGQFQKWYEKLIITKLVDHLHVKFAKLIVEDSLHESTKHLNKEFL